MRRGFGNAAGEIALSNEPGGELRVSNEALVDLFGCLKDNIRIVVLNACYSAPGGAVTEDVV